MRSRPDRRWRVAVLAIAVVVGLAACDDGDSTSSKPVVEVFGPVVGEPGEQLGAALRNASSDSSVELRYIGVTSFDAQLADRLDQGDRPGVVLLPQPGRLADLSRRGVLQPLADDLVATIDEQYPQALVDLGSIDGQPAGAWLTVDVKGLVWYRPSVFAEQGVEIPRTLDEFDTLAAEERADGDAVAPFCLAVGAGSSTGWVGTDWVESYVVRRLGPDAYDRWVAGDLPFDSPEIESVFDEIDTVLRSPGAMAGGAGEALSTPWELAADQLLAPSSRCLMVHQADFLRRRFPAGTTIGPDGDADFFVLPDERAGTPPVLLGGMIAAPLDDAPEVAEAMKILAGADLAQGVSDTGQFLSPHLGVDWGAIGDATSARLVDLVRAAPVVRFDGSDLMPPEIGTGTFWSGMRAFLSGEATTTVLAAIEAGRPS